MVNLKGKHPKTKRKLQNTEERKREREGEKASQWNSTQRCRCTTTTNQRRQQPNLNPAKNPNPNTNHRETYIHQTQDLRRAATHDPTTTHGPTNPIPPTSPPTLSRSWERKREREGKRASFDDWHGVIWWSVWRGLKWRNPERWEWEAKRVRWTEVRSVDWKWRKPEIWEWERRELEAERVRWRREKQI